MKAYEKESLLKNFLVFFSLLEALLILLFLELFHTQKEEYKQDIYKTMQVCSYTFSCDQFHFDFAPQDSTILHHLYDDRGLYSYFTIPKSKKFNLEISYPSENLLQDIDKIKDRLWIKFLLATFTLSLLALFFTFYSLKPIRKALKLNDEFIKDIIHDFNTPITAMRLNLHMFDQENEKNPFIEKTSHSLDTIMILQNNLKSFLYHSPSQTQILDIAKIAKERLDTIENIYPNLTFRYQKNSDLRKRSNKELFIRIIDNLLTNAAKYNKPDGEVVLIIEDNSLIIKDTGKGIKDIKKVFSRYYTEQEQGLGLGMHIVQKLTNQLGIMIDIVSKEDIGTKITLSFSHNPKGLS